MHLHLANVAKYTPQNARLRAHKEGMAMWGSEQRKPLGVQIECVQAKATKEKGKLQAVCNVGEKQFKNWRMSGPVRSTGGRA